MPKPKNDSRIHCFQCSLCVYPTPIVKTVEKARYIMRRHWKSTHPDIVRFCLFPECGYNVAYGTTGAVKQHALKRHGADYGEALCVVHPAYAKCPQPKDRSDYVNEFPFYRFVVPDWNKDAEGEIDEECAGHLKAKLFVGCGLVHRLYRTPHWKRGLMKGIPFEPEDSEYDPEDPEEDDLEQAGPPSPTWTDQIDQLFPMDDAVKAKEASAEQSTPTWDMLLLPESMDTAMNPRPAFQDPHIAGPSNLAYGANTSFYNMSGIAPFNYLSQTPAASYPLYYGQGYNANLNASPWFDLSGQPAMFPGMEY